MGSAKWLLIFVVLCAILVLPVGKFINNLYKDKTNYEILDPIAKTKSIFSFFIKQKPKPQSIVFGYLPYWSIDKLKYIQLDKLTDIAYFGLNIKDDGTFQTTLDDGTAEPGYNHWRNDKDLANFIGYAKKMGIRISLTIISHDDTISDKFLGCKDCWPVLLNSIKTELDYQHITDVNLNFEYVDFQKSEMADNYTQLTQYLNTELDKTYGNSFVTVATFADAFVKPRVTNVEQLGKVADALFIMAYDFQQPNSDSAGPVAPIEGKGTESSYDITTMLKDYLAVVPPNKLLFGVPYYGYNWIVEEDKPLAKRVPGNDTIGKSQSQAYSDIMDAILDLKPVVNWDDVGKVPYFTYKSKETGMTREVYFENAQSLKVKYDLIKQNNLAGVGIWALGYDGGYQELWNLLGDEFLKQ